jgi:O-antigen/teichoic acid export membrane protein
MWLIPDALSTLLFGSSDYVYLLVPVAAMVGALVLHVVLFAFLRGTLHFVVGNTLHVVVYGVLPVAAILVLDASPTATLLALAASIGVMVVIFGYRWLRAAARASGVQATSYELLKNGVPRVPAAFGVLALFGLPPITVAHSDSFVSAAFVSLGMSVVTIVGSAFSPLAVVLLPLAARARAARSSSELFAKFAYLIPFAIVVGIVVALVLALGGNLMARALVGHDETVLAHVFRWVGIAAAPYIYFVCARPMVDAHASSFTVTRLVIVAVAVYLAVWILCLQSFGFAALDSALYGHVCSIYALALGTFLEFGRVVRASAAHV